jgi:hypothetical protein
MNGKENELFRKRIILAVCFAGSDRSRFIAEELNDRGYVASYAGVNKNHNYVTEQDLVGIGAIIFTTQKVRNMFKKDKQLNKILKANKIPVHTINITESEKEKAIQSGNEKLLRRTISQELDGLGFKNITNF